MREEVLIPNPKEVERRRQRLEYVSAISSWEWLRETKVVDQVNQLYSKLKLLSCQVGNLSYQDVFYDPRVGINIIFKSLVLEAFPDKTLTFSKKRLQWISSQTIEMEGILRVVQTKIGEYGIFLDYHIFDIPKGDPPFILIGRPIEGVLSSVLDHEKQHIILRFEIHISNVIDLRLRENMCGLWTFLRHRHWILKTDSSMKVLH
jgi:hypothetical protein